MLSPWAASLAMRVCRSSNSVHCCSCLIQNSGFLILLLCFGIFRTVVADWNTIPSGSRRPTILEGDVVEMREEVLFINGKAAEYGSLSEAAEPLEQGGTTPAIRATEQVSGWEHAVQFLPKLPAQRTFGPYVIPAGNHFFLGDNRDNNNDSRYIGPVEKKLLIGRAHHVAVSLDTLGSWLPRWGRTGEKIR